MNSLMKNKAVTVVVAIIVLAVIAYGGYRLYKHFSRVVATTPAPVAQKSVTPSPTASASANTVYKTASTTKLGSYLTDLKGMTLYTFKDDKPGVSNCTAACLVKWPAYLATAGTGTNLPANITVVKRSNGTNQYAYKGMPLYYYYLDKNPGQTNGEGVLGLWYVAKF